MHKILKDLQRVLPNYRPVNPGYHDCSQASAVFNIGSFVSKWPEAINAKIFEAHLKRIENSHALMRKWFTKERKEPVAHSDITFFIRTYSGDTCWLPLLLESLEHFGNNIKRVFCTDIESESTVRAVIGTNETLVVQEQFCPGSIHQKYSKLTADRFCESKYIIYLDSDCILCKPFESVDWFYNGKPCLEYTTIDEIERWFQEQGRKGGSPSIWRDGVAHALGDEVDKEFSRRIEKVYKRSWLPEMRSRIESVHGVSFEKFIAAQKGVKSPGDRIDQLYFSDFNYMGAFLWKYKRDDIHWIDTRLMGFWCRPLASAQFHSYSMTINVNGTKKITEVPYKFLSEVEKLWASSSDYVSSLDLIQDLYLELRARYRY